MRIQGPPDEADRRSAQKRALLRRTSINRLATFTLSPVAVMC